NGHTTLDQRIAALAEEQHGVVTVAQLEAVGLDGRSVRHRAAAGRLHRIHRGVYAVGHRRLDRTGRRLAVVLACGEGAVLSHVSAAEAWGLRGGSSVRWHVTAPHMSGGRTGPDTVVLHRTRHLGPDDVDVVDGVPVTSVARTLVDLAGTVNATQLARAVHEAEVLRLLDVDAIAAAMARVPRRRGARRLRELLGHTDPAVTAATFVRAFLRLCERHRLPRPETDVHLPAGGRLIEADLLFRAQRVIVELDGEAVHHTRRNFHSDRRRDAALAAEGYLTVRLTWHRVTREAPATAAELRRILAVRS
ncbi:MAG TPA: type IV toxin-antitoxin system AbiEi family antitoxin domain-containing protein, partial [Baekduia sp.]|nr:type IV toxin-antitoxin system AbiEi family antitoxin domain-containing protein [Baekduia sp.]